MNNIVMIAAAFGISFVIMIIAAMIIKSKKRKKYKKIIEDLDYQKNRLDTSPVGPELAKVENYLNNEKLELLYKNWKERLDDIKEIKIPKITDMLIEAEYSLSKKDYKSTMYKIAKLEMEIYKVRATSAFLLNEIKGVTESEEKNRGSITKLKARYRELYEKFEDTENEFGEFAKIVALQFENISKRFEDFEILMENNEYTEIQTILKAIDDMLKHMEVILDELPSIVLIAEGILPKKMEEIEAIYKKMVSEGYPLDYLNVEYNIGEAKKKIADVLKRARVLNIEDSLFDLKVLTEYFENLFTDFEKEKVIKADYLDANKTLQTKLKKINTLVNDIFEQMDDLKQMYSLSDESISDLCEVRSDLNKLNEDYGTLISHTNNHSFAYSKLTEEIESLVIRLSNIENKLDTTLNIIGNMHDDEMRARQQLAEVEDLLRNSQKQIRLFNLPVIPNSYFVELKEAKEAMGEIVKELDKKPITIETLNTRVDTARDLALKLYGKTKEMMRTAMFAEMAIVYGNRYRSSEKDLDKNLNYSEVLFNKGDYHRSLELTINYLNKIEPGIYEKLLNFYGGKEN
ncbi:MAG: septation ring formation regulator EzrA [Bacilli bacterium]|nr:septation ring formation regulator EzrA [Bacilli bacterium]